jgi:hypothetical protein
MKRIIYFFLIFFCIPSFGQDGLENILVEAIPVDTTIANQDSNLSSDAITYRIFADMHADWQILSVFGNLDHKLLFSTDSSFYNTRNSGQFLGRNIDSLSFDTLPQLKYDSWISINSATNAHLGIPLEEDADSSGLIVGTSLLTQRTGADFSIPFGNTIFNGAFETYSGTYFVSQGVSGPTSSNRVLLGQFTTNGNFSFELNIRIIHNISSEERIFVARNPQLGEYTNSSLVYPAQFGCTSSSACNFDALATIDDGSCIEPILPCYDCFGDTIALVDTDSNTICDALQEPLENVIVETYYISDSNDFLTDASLTPGSVTRRVFIDMAPGCELVSVFGSAVHQLRIETNGSFYNNSQGSTLANEVDTSNFSSNPSLALDSWISLGNATSAFHDGILKSEDSDGSFISELQNNNPLAGIPVNIADGLIPGIEKSIITPAIDLTSFDTGGDSIVLNSGGWVNIDSASGPTTKNQILIFQATTDGNLSFNLNVSIETPDGQNFNYVSSNPQGNEILSELLSYPQPIAGCTSVTACNYDSLATLDDGSCIEPIFNCTECVGDTIQIIDSDSDGICDADEIPGCTSLSACNFDSLATDDDGSCLEPVFNCTECIGDTLQLIDSDSDGICDADEIPGCTSITACNFDSLATDDDGSCIEPVFNCLECVGDTVQIIDTDSDGICDADEIPGCTSITACNFNSLATDEDGSCLEPVFNCTECVGDTLQLIDSDSDGVCDADEIAGCTSLSACNYNPLATDEDGSCIEPVFECTECIGDTVQLIDTDNDGICDANEIPGCTSLTACNFDSLATDDDGSCLEPVFNCAECSADSLLIIDTDGDGLCDADDPNPFDLPYRLDTIQNSCLLEEICVPLIAVDSVEGVIGYDITMNYDGSKIVPTGGISINPELSAEPYIDYNLSFNALAGTLNLAIYLDGSAPPLTYISGKDELFCVGFAQTASLNYEDTLQFSLPFLMESYPSTTLERPVQPAIYTTSKDSTMKGQLLFWNNYVPIAYDTSQTSNYLATQILPADDACTVDTNFASVPNIQGEFIFDTRLSSTYSIDRGIAASTDVMELINGYDAILVLQTLMNTQSYFPSVYQFIAMDVNTDGVVSAGDVSQINLRTVSVIDEFMQSWNYDYQGNSNGEASKDWLWVKDSVALNNSEFMISSTYPNDDGNGYSRWRVPQLDHCFTIPSIDECTFPEQRFIGTLLGDVDGNYLNLAPNGLLKNGNAHVLLHIEQLNNENPYLFELNFSLSEEINAFAFDLDMELINELFLVDSIFSLNEYDFFVPNIIDNTIKITLGSLQGLPYNTPLFGIQVLSEQISELSDMDYTLNVLIDGIESSVSINQTNLISSSFADFDIKVYPNPATNYIYLESEQHVTARLMTLKGEVISETISVRPNMLSQLDISHIMQGIYIMQLFNNNTALNKKVIIER